MSFFPNLNKVVTVSSAQILTMFSAPVQLVPGRSGCIIDIKSMILVYHAGSHAYVTSGNDLFAPFTGILPHVFDSVANFASGFVDQTTDQMMFIENWWSVGDTNSEAIPLSDVIGSGIYLWQYNPTGPGFPNGANWTTGNGTLTVYIEYSYIVA